MDESKALTVVNSTVPTSVDEVLKFADVMARSGFFDDAREAAKAAVKIQFGRELGFGPATSMAGVYIQNGKPSVSAELMATGIMRGGKYDFSVKTLTDQECVLAFYRITGGKRELLGESRFTMDDAKRAELTTGRNAHSWRKFPRNMLFARAVSNGKRWFCPDAFGVAVYTHEEMGIVIDGETGEIIDGEATVIDPPAQPDRPSPQPSPAAPQTNGNGKRPWAPDVLIPKLRAMADKPFAGTHESGAKGSTVGWLDEICGDKDRRYTLLHEVFGKRSSKDLTESEWEALDIWRRVDAAGLFRPQNGRDIAIDLCRDEANRVINAAIAATAAAALPGME